MLVVRPAGPADLDHLLELAILSGPGFTSLPEDPDALAERLDLSQASFEGRVPWQEAWYTLMLEDGDTGDIDGVGSVKATVGLKRPFFSFRVVNNTVQSPSLGVKLDHQTLVLVNECTGWTEVGSLFLKADRRKGGAGRLLSQSRYMLIGAQPDLFADMVLAELRGVFTPDGACPFWDHVAHKFFPMEFDEADRIVANLETEAGARRAFYQVLRLPWEVNPLFQEWLQTHFPERAQRVMNRIRDMRGGKDYDANFATRMRGEGLWADMIRQRFAKALKRYGLNKSGSFLHMDCSQFRRPLSIPAKTNHHGTGQLDIFG